LGIHPRETHTDWAKVGINRAIIDDNAQMQNLYQLLKSTLLQVNKTTQSFLYPEEGMQQAWRSVSERIEALGGRIITGQGAVMEGREGRVHTVRAGDESFEPSTVIWTAPITLACEQLGQERPKLDYLGLLLYNVMVEGQPPRDYQWCYYGARDLLINRVSIPRFFSSATCPEGAVGYCCEVTCRVGDDRWKHAERLTDWVVDDLVRVGMFPNRRAVIDARVERLAESYPIYHQSYPGELDTARRSLAQFENLHLAGRTGLFWYNNLDHSMANAMQLVERLLREAGRSHVREAALAAGALGA
jgi:protoporphyrinogen oxidase